MALTRKIVGLRAELEDFLAEVDSISSAVHKFAVSPPASDWVVRVDPVTRKPTYSNVLSGETSLQMPHDYKCYLDEFSHYLKLPDSTTPANLLDYAHHSSDHFTRRKLTCYSESSEDSVTSSDPVVPADSSSTATTTATANATPIQPISTHDPPIRSTSQKHTCDVNLDYYLRKTIRVLKNRFGSLGVNKRRIEPLHYLYSQLMVRVEDWLHGELSAAQCMQKLEQLESKLIGHIPGQPNNRSPDSRPTTRIGDVASVSADQPTSQSLAVVAKPIDVIPNSASNTDPTHDPTIPSSGCLGPPANNIQLNTGPETVSRRKHLEAQLAEFELACQMLEEKSVQPHDRTHRNSQ